MKYLFLLLLLSCNKVEEIGHQCKWKMCPYKGVINNNSNSAIIKYTENGGTALDVSLDSLHILQPTWEYDQLIETIEN